MAKGAKIDFLDEDGLLDVIVCDDKGNFVSWIRQQPAGVYTETILVDNLLAPAHVEVRDFDFDSDKDLIVKLLGMLFPNNDPTHLLTCEPGDFNNDGLMDVVTGGMHTYPPYNRMGRITIWIHNGLIH